MAKSRGVEFELFNKMVENKLKIINSNFNNINLIKQKI